jgi:hypothetical protein
MVEGNVDSDREIWGGGAGVPIDYRFPIDPSHTTSPSIPYARQDNPIHISSTISTTTVHFASTAKIIPSFPFIPADKSPVPPENHINDP